MSNIHYNYFLEYICQFFYLVFDELVKLLNLLDSLLPLGVKFLIEYVVENLRRRVKVVQVSLVGRKGGKNVTLSEFLWKMFVSEFWNFLKY